MKGKALYPLNDDCFMLQKTCHRTINRILELMVKHPEHSKNLSKYAKKCMVMEKLCEYVCGCCCNDDNVSIHMMSELREKCRELKDISNVLNSELPKDKSLYIRCEIVSKLCDKRMGSTRSKKSHKKTKLRKSSKKNKKKITN